MVRELYRNLALILVTVTGVVLLWLYMNSRVESRGIQQERDEYQYRIDSLIQERDSLLRESGRFSREIDSLTVALDRSVKNEQKVRSKYAQLRRDLNGYTTDEHVMFLAEQLSE